jgi:hypothetical protein
MRPTVLSLPPQLVFPAATFKLLPLLTRIKFLIELALGMLSLMERIIQGIELDIRGQFHKAFYSYNFHIFVIS